MLHFAKFSLDRPLNQHRCLKQNLQTNHLPYGGFQHHFTLVSTVARNVFPKHVMSLWLGPGLSFPLCPGSLKTCPRRPVGHSLSICWQRSSKITPELTRKGRKAFSAIRCFDTSSNLGISEGKSTSPCQERSSATALLRVLPFILSELR